MSNTLYLTFDDGPDPKITPKILDTLREYKMKATFFVIGGKVAQYPEIVRAAVQQGHVIGLHCQEHRPLPSLTRTEAESDLDEALSTIQSCGAGRPRFFRPPDGRWGCREWWMARRRNLRLTMWSVDSANRCMSNPEAALESALKDKLERGDIILLHDCDANLPIILPQMLNHLQQQGWESVTLNESGL